MGLSAQQTFAPVTADVSFGLNLSYVRGAANDCSESPVQTTVNRVPQVVNLLSLHVSHQLFRALAAQFDLARVNRDARSRTATIGRPDIVALRKTI